MAERMKGEWKDEKGRKRIIIPIGIHKRRRKGPFEQSGTTRTSRLLKEKLHQLITE